MTRWISSHQTDAAQAELRPLMKAFVHYQERTVMKLKGDFLSKMMLKELELTW